MIYPFIHVLSISFSSLTEAIRPGLHLIPLEPSLEAYKATLSSDYLWIGLGNSIFRTVAGTILSLLFMTMGAYPLSRKYLPHRGFYTYFIVVTMFFSGGLIPSYMLVKSLGMINTYWALLIPCLINTFSMLIIRNFFMSLPDEIEDSAKMDGANDIRILFSIVIPLSKPILATIALWSAVYHWNAWFDALLYVHEKSKLVLQIYLRRLVIDSDTTTLDQMLNQQVTPETIKAAIIMLTSIPILILYPFLQKHFVKGILIGAVKG